MLGSSIRGRNGRSPFLSLLRTSLNVNFSLSAFRHLYFVERKRLWEIPLYLLLGFSILSVVGLYAELLVAVYNQTALLGQGHVILTMAILFGQVLVLVFGIYYLIATYYFADDLELLVSLPLTPVQVMCAKFLTVLVSDYLTLAPVLIPAFIVYGIKASVTGFYWPLALLVFILAPVFPLVLSSVVVVPLMRVTNVSRSRDVIRAILSLLIIFAALGSQYFFQQLPGADPEQLIQDILLARNGLVNIMSRGFPPSRWLTNAASVLDTGTTVTGLVSSLFGAAGSLGLLYLIGRYLFYPSLLGGNEVSRRRRRSASKVTEAAFRRRGVLSSLIIREFKMFYRHPIFLMNGALNTIIFPVLLLLPGFFGSTFSGGGPGLAELIQGIVNSSEGKQLVTFVIAGAVTVISGLNAISSTSISREGQLFWISRSLPVPAKTHIAAKFIHAAAWSLLGGLLVLVDAVVLLPVGDIGVAPLVIGFILGLLGALTMNSIGLLIDVWMPKTDWANPHRAMKGNTNVLFTMIPTAVITGLLGYGTQLMIKNGAPFVLSLLFDTAGLLLIGGVALKLTVGRGETLYTRYEG